MTETIIVGVIVGVVLVLVGRSLYRTMTGKDSGCAGCGTKSCSEAARCPSAAKEKKEETRLP